MQEESLFIFVACGSTVPVAHKSGCFLHMIGLQMMASRMRTEQQLRTSEQHSALHQEKGRQMAERLMSVERASRLSVGHLPVAVPFNDDCLHKVTPDPIHSD